MSFDLICHRLLRLWDWRLKPNQKISSAQIFVQQPRNSPNSLSVPYCQQKPRNPELNGLFQCQFQGVDPNKFADGSALGAPGTIPLGQNAPLNPPGSCPANPSGPISNGQQLVDAQSPGVPGEVAQRMATSSSSAASAANTSPPPTQTTGTNSSVSGSGSDFHLQNGKDAQALNQKFQSLIADNPCIIGEQACVNGQFARCEGGKFSLTPCSNGLTCTALALVKKPGTSVTCDSQADSAARIANALGSKSG